MEKRNLRVMRKNIDIDEALLTKLKILSAFEDMSVKALMEKAVSFFVEYKEKERLASLSQEEKEDLGLLLLMQQADRNDKVSEDDIMKALD
jgi:Arc/MetJ family transcription regulator